ncbi:uncharacterized protein [Diadema antillarum]|uniref:uncharacterized protein isoform X2 n=2 Tax=Diadema antillarum TaxID=105358 RepID=UPI003A84359F
MTMVIMYLILIPEVMMGTWYKMDAVSCLAFHHGKVSRAVVDPSREALGSHPLYRIHGSASDEKKFKSRERRLNWPVFVPDMPFFHPSVSEVTLNGESMLALHCSLDVIQGLRVYWLKAQMNQTICGSCLSQLCG